MFCAARAVLAASFERASRTMLSDTFCRRRESKAGLPPPALTGAASKGRARRVAALEGWSTDPYPVDTMIDTWYTHATSRVCFTLLDDTLHLTSAGTVLTPFPPRGSDDGWSEFSLNLARFPWVSEALVGRDGLRVRLNSMGLASRRPGSRLRSRYWRASKKRETMPARPSRPA